jgi:O-antigen/teichoic acid export membrane protein
MTERFAGGSVRRRIWWAFVANGAGRAAQIVEQLLLVPLLLSMWGSERYGEWIALTSLAAFAAVTSIGVGHAGFSDILLRHAGGDDRAAGRSFITTIVLVTVIVVIAFALLVAALAVVPLADIVTLRALPLPEARNIVLIIGLQALLIFYVEPFAGVLGAAVGAWLPNLISAAARASGLIAIAVALSREATPQSVALILLATTIGQLSLSLLLGLWLAPWMSLRLRDFDTHALARTWRASLGFFGLTVFMGVIYFQVPRLVVFHFFGAPAVAAFTVFVTYTRAARMLALMVSQAAQVEIGRAFGHGHSARFKLLIETAASTSVVAAAILLAGALGAAPLIVPLWTHGHVAIAWDLLWALGVAALIGTYFDALLVSVSALNRVGVVALYYGAALSVALAIGTSVAPLLGPVAIAAALIVPEIAGAVAALQALRAAAPDAAIRAFGRPRLRTLIGGGARQETV